MKVAIYCRVSTDEQNVDTQEKICLEYCKRNNYEVFKVYKDIMSGKTISRPEFNQMLDDSRSQKFNCIMVTKLDRVGRSLQHLLSLFEEWSNKSIHFIATTQNIDTSSASGRLQMQIMGAFAEFERNLISERTKESRVGKVNWGKRGKDKQPRLKRGGLKTAYFPSIKDTPKRGTALVSSQASIMKGGVTPSDVTQGESK